MYLDIIKKIIVVKSMMLEKGLEKDKIEAEAFSEKMKRY